MKGIYLVTNSLNGKVYVGKSIDIERRWQEHIHDSLVSQDQWDNNYRGVRTHFHAAIRKYGKENFTFRVIEEIEDDTILNDREIYWIAQYHANEQNIGYNMTAGGDGYNFGSGENAICSKITKAECDLIKQKLKERWSYKDIQTLVPQIGISAMNAINYGKTWYDETETYPICIDSGHRKWSDEEAMGIKKEYANGATITELAKKYDVRYETISNLVNGKSYTNLPVLERQVDWKRVSKTRGFTEEEVLHYRYEFYHNHRSIMSLHKEYGKGCYATFYNMIKGITYKNIGGLE